MKHYIIAAKLGNDKSLENLTNGYRAGHVSKEDFTAALRGYQAAIAATKSPQREEAAEYADYATEQERRRLYLLADDRIRYEICIGLIIYFTLYMFVCSGVNPFRQDFPMAE